MGINQLYFYLKIFGILFYFVEFLLANFLACFEGFFYFQLLDKFFYSQRSLSCCIFLIQHMGNLYLINFVFEIHIKEPGAEGINCWNLFFTKFSLIAWEEIFLSIFIKIDFIGTDWNFNPFCILASFIKLFNLFWRYFKWDPINIVRDPIRVDKQISLFSAGNMDHFLLL